MGKSFVEPQTRRELDVKSEPNKPHIANLDLTVAEADAKAVVPADSYTSGVLDTYLAIQWTLVDPLVKDLDTHSRYYLYHFANQLCSDMVYYDGPGHNPIRDLIPATSGHPLLLNIMIANSAFHVYNFSREPLRPSKYQGSSRTSVLAYYRAVSPYGGAFQSSYRDALLAKQVGLSLLYQALENVNGSNFDIVFAAVLLFIYYELVESGKQSSWKIHFEGARKLMGLLGDAHFGTVLSRNAAMSKLRTCLLADTVVIFVLGSTLTFSSHPNRFIPENIDINPILRYAETNNYLSCPAPLLGIMLRAFEIPDSREQHSYDDVLVIEERVKVLLEAALSFDPVSWASTFQPASPDENIESRVRIASAHRAAVCLYVARVLPDTSPLLNPSSSSAIMNLQSMATEIVHHISHLNRGEQVFKSISWALFLAGAETDIPEQRKWIMETLDVLWLEMYWGYVRTVKEVLQLIWGFKDRFALGENICWVDEIKRLGTDLLIA